MNRRALLVAALAATFLTIDLTFYFMVTTRYINHTTDGFQAKSIELTDYLPYGEGRYLNTLDSEPSFSFTERDDIPVIDSAAALYPVEAAFADSVYPENSVSFNGKDFNPDSCLQMNNTREAYRRIVDGEDDIILVAGPSDEQRQYAADKGVELEYIPIGREAFVFIVNAGNPVSELSQEQIRDMYTGKIRNWSEVGGDNYPVCNLQRNPGSGSQSAFLRFMGGEEPVANPLGLAGRAIGFSFRYYVSDLTSSGKVKMLSVDGVYPDARNVKTGEYPLVSNFYAVYRPDNPNPNVTAFIDWMLSEEGQRLIEVNGYVDAN